MNYVIVAATFSGNKGAASMLEASIQTLTTQDPEAEFTVFTVYAENDMRFNIYPNVKILSTKPLFLGLVLNPLAVLYKLLPTLRPILCRQRHLKALSEANVLLDEGGITFVDGRERFLIYNVATILPALFMKIPVIKCSQAMGPFRSWINNLTAKAILPKVKIICARGHITYKYLKKLGLTNVIQAADYAFLLEIGSEQKEKAFRTLAPMLGLGARSKSNRKTVAIMPSEVVYKKALANGQDYIKYNIDLIHYLLERGDRVLLVAYSARSNSGSRHNNDLPVCREIAVLIKHQNFTFIEEEMSAQILRYLIGQMDIVITSRFHAMIAALSMGRIPLVVGWSHKYVEVMDLFGLSRLALDSRQLNLKAIKDIFEDVYTNQNNIEKAIKLHLKAVKLNAQKQVKAIINAVQLS